MYRQVRKSPRGKNVALDSIFKNLSSLGFGSETEIKPATSSFLVQL